MNRGYKGEVNINAIKNVLEKQNVQFRKRMHTNLELQDLSKQKDEIDKKQLYQMELEKKKLRKKQKELEALKNRSVLEKKMDGVMLNKNGFDRLIEKELLLEKETIIDKVQNEEISSLARMRTMFADFKDDMDVRNDLKMDNSAVDAFTNRIFDTEMED